MAVIIDLEQARKDRQPGWRVASRVMCLACGSEWVAVLEPGCKPVRLQCSECHNYSGIVMEWDRG